MFDPRHCFGESFSQTVCSYNDVHGLRGTDNEIRFLNEIFFFIESNHVLIIDSIYHVSPALKADSIDVLLTKYVIETLQENYTNQDKKQVKLNQYLFI